MYRKSLLCLLFLIYFTQISVCAETFIVTSKDDVVAQDKKLSLREAIALSNQTPEEDIIVFDRKVRAIKVGSSISITSALRISGPITLDGQKTQQIFDIDLNGINEKLFFAKMIFKQGFTTDSGAALNIQFLGTGGSLHLVSCSFDKNIAQRNGGAVAVFGQGDIEVISDCTFKQNQAANGGAIHVDGDTDIDQITQCLFQKNIAQQEGGAIDIDFGVSVGQINVSTFDGNFGGRFGGAIDSDGAIIEINNCIFKKNKTDNFGGAISSFGALDFINSCLFDGNTAQAGGAIRNNDVNADTEIHASTFKKNSSSENGGAISAAAPTKIITSIFDSNKSLAGGAIFNSNIMELKNCNVLKNQTKGGNGGAIFHSNGTFNISETTFEANKTDKIGGAIFSAADAFLSCNNVTFSKNQAFDGGAISCKGDFNITFCTIAFNSARNQGGGLIADVANSSVRNTIIAKNKAKIHTDASLTTQDNDFNLVLDGTGSNIFGGGNIVGIDPLLLALKDNGIQGLKTHEPKDESVVINSADPNAEQLVDGRLFLRDNLPDIGAFEVGGIEPTGSKFLPATRRMNYKLKMKCVKKRDRMSILHCKEKLLYQSNKH